MKRFLRALRWTLLGLAVLIALVLGAAWFIEFRQTDAELTAEFANQPVRPRVGQYRVPEAGQSARTIRFMETPALPGQPTVIFIHGAPSSLSFFNGFFKDATLLHRAQLVAVDRPGYGYSDFGRVERSIVKQAELLQPLLNRYKRNPAGVVLVGSSYGGSVAARLAMNNPALVRHVVFVSSALGPGLERTYAISYLADLPIIRPIVAPLLRLANDEKLAHRQALEALLPDWGRIRAAITMLHGQRDDLVFPSNVAFARQRLIHARFKEFILPESRHDIVLNKRDYVTGILLDVLGVKESRPVAGAKTAPVTRRRLKLEDFISNVIRI